jgi:imidazolonepropionase-like amidohydrolase
MPHLSRAALCAALVLGAVPASAQQLETAFVDVTVIPMDRERSVPHQTVLVRGDRIAAIGPVDRVPVPPGATRVDGRGKYLIPGLAEMHAHIPGAQAPESMVERTLFLYVSGGITTIRGMLGDPRHLELRARAARSELLSPTIYAAGPSLNGTSLPTPDSAVRAVEQQKAAGYDLLKIHPGLKPDVFDAVVTTANRVGIRFAGHVPADVGLARAIEAHYWSIEHLDGYVEAMLRPDSPVPASESALFGMNLGEHLDQSKLPDLVRATKAAGVWNVPTQVLMVNLIAVPVAELSRRPELRYVPDSVVVKWTETRNTVLQETGSTPASARQMLDTRRRIIRELHAAGAGLLLGSDAPQVWNVPGFSTHRELESLVAAGLTPWQALETGTRNVAEFFGTSKESGTVETGKRADLVLLEADPLTDIRNTTRRAGVMLRGHWLPQAEIDRRLSAVARAVGKGG